MVSRIKRSKVNVVKSWRPTLPVAHPTIAERVGNATRQIKAPTPKQMIRRPQGR